jgi:hypothetical protein
LHEGASEGNGLNTIVKESKKKQLAAPAAAAAATPIHNHSKIESFKNTNPKKKKKKEQQQRQQQKFCSLKTQTPRVPLKVERDFHSSFHWFAKEEEDQDRDQRTTNPKNRGKGSKWVDTSLRRRSQIWKGLFSKP